MKKRLLHPNHTAVPQNFCRLPDGYGVVKIGVSGAADTTYAGLDAFEKAKEIGREIARHGAIITTGATTGCGGCDYEVAKLVEQELNKKEQQPLCNEFI